MKIQNNITQNLRAALAISLVGVGGALFTGCQDEHFDVVSTSLTGDQTIWQNIQSRPELSQYADILQSVYYSQTEEKTTSETYADLFNGDQTFTVWAPVNGQFDYTYYKNLLSTGIRDSIYKVEKELIRNNMTRYSQVINKSDSVKLNLFNSKFAWLNYDNKTIKGVSITTPNIGASNGVLHITDGAVAYQPNLYEYLATRPDLDSLNTFLKSFQTTEFNERASTQGPTIDGNITWVDSITYVANLYTNNLMEAYLTREDSNYVMIMPTNTPWKEVLAKTQQYNKYKPTSYRQILHTVNESGRDVATTVDRIALTTEQIDSLSNLYSKDAICRHLTFNANWQYERIPITSLSDIQALDARSDSLHSTSGKKFKKAGTLNVTDSRSNVLAVDNFATIFGNAEPVELSNGYAYVVDQFAYPTTSYAINFDKDAASCMDAASAGCNYSNLPWTSTYSTWEKYEPVIDPETGEQAKDEDLNPIYELVGTRDSIYKYNYLVMTPATPSAENKVWFALENVQSCKYDIFVVVGWNDAYNLPNHFQAFMTYNTATGFQQEKALNNPNEDAVDDQGNSLFGDEYFVNKKPELDENLVMNYLDTICIAKDFEFPVSYYGLNAIDGLADTYPQLCIQSYVANRQINRFTRELRINAIILKAKEW